MVFDVPRDAVARQIWVDVVAGEDAGALEAEKGEPLVDVCGDFFVFVSITGGNHVWGWLELRELDEDVLCYAGLGGERDWCMWSQGIRAGGY